MKARLVAATVFLVAGLHANPALSFPDLNLTPGTPNIESSFVTVDYVGNSINGTLTASGFPNRLTPPGSPAGNIAGGSFDINASLSPNFQFATGTLAISGTIASQGFNSGTLLTGSLVSSLVTQTFGAGTNDPLEFLFNVTGGDAAPLFGGIGGTAGVILSQSGYTGSFGANFTSGPFQALADTFGVQAAVPEPATLTMFLLGLLGLGVLRLRRGGPDRSAA